MPKWSILTGEYPPACGGVGDYTVMLAEALAASGADVSIFTPTPAASAPVLPGVRVVTLRTGGVPETIPAGVDGRERIVGDIETMTMLGRAATLEDVGNVAAFVASDRARTMTAATANISCGAGRLTARRKGVI